jgi:anti-anti-sigma regulatory factor
VAGAEDALKGRIKEMASSGMNKMILDLSKVSEVNISLVKIIMSVLKSCKASGIKVRIVGTGTLEGELKGFHETSELPIEKTIEKAKELL